MLVFGERKNRPAWQPVGLGSGISVAGKHFGVLRDRPFPTGCQPAYFTLPTVATIACGPSLVVSEAPVKIRPTLDKICAAAGNKKR